METGFQIFFDITGRRRKITDFFLSIFLIFSSCLLLFIGAKIIGVEGIKKIGKKINNQEYSHETKVAMLYTENHESSLKIFSEQVSNLDTLIVPRYLIADKVINIPEDYELLVKNMEYIETNSPTHYKKFFLLSEVNYSIPPTERQNRRVNNDFIYLGEKNLDQIVNDLVKNDIDGLLLEVDFSDLEAETLLPQYLNQINTIKRLFEINNLKLGLKFRINDFSEKKLDFFSRADLLYIDYDYSSGFNLALNSFSEKKDLLGGKKIIFELPTISQKTSLDLSNDYINSIDYAEIEKLILETKISNRDFEDPAFTRDNFKYILRDAVSSYNYMTKIESNTLSGSNEIMEYSVCDPGFEEFTVWNIITDNFSSEKISLLSNNIKSTVKVNLLGEGKIFGVYDSSEFGIRELETDGNNTIITSTVKKSYKPGTVIKSGKKENKIALTFDDGPHPVYTKKILDILDKYNVKATFYMVGENIASYPSLAKEIADKGHEIENHSYSHPHFNFLDAESLVNQIASDNKLIEEITGKKPKYFRLPYGEDNELDTSSDFEYLLMLKNEGLKASEYDIDSKDWTSSSGKQIEDKVINDIEKSNGNYSQILFHDSSVNSIKTIEALPQIIEYLMKKNIEIVLVSELSQEEKQQNSNVTNISTAIDLMNKIMKFFSYLMIFFFGFSVFKYTWVIVGMVIYNIKRVLKNNKTKEVTEYNKKISIIIACYNEEKVIGKTIESLQLNGYHNIEIIISNDGSVDKTAEIVREYASSDDRIVLLDLEHGGKAKAIDAGIYASTGEWLVFCDADTIFKKDSIKKFSNLIAQNGKLAAVAGRILVGNNLNLLTYSQFIEYAIAHRFLKPTQDVFNSITVVPGAIGLWNKSKLLKAGGFAPNTLAEDADTTIKVVSLGNRVRFDDDVVAKTEVPETLRMLFKQRTRWQLGNMQALRKHYKGFMNYRYGPIGFIGLPMLFIEITNAVLFPMFILFIAWLFIADYNNMSYVFSAMQVEYIYSETFRQMSMALLLFEIFLCVGSITVEEAYPRTKLTAFATLPFYFTFYKFFLSYCAIVSFLRALRGTSQGWGHMTRTSHVKLKDVV